MKAGAKLRMDHPLRRTQDNTATLTIPIKFSQYYSNWRRAHHAAGRITITAAAEARQERRSSDRLLISTHSAGTWILRLSKIEMMRLDRSKFAWT
jgi:hypothetical protein